MLAYLWSKLVKVARGTALRNTRVHPSSRVHSGSTLVDCTVDRHSFVGYDCQLLNVELGPFCSLASHLCIGGVAHPAHFVSTSPVFLAHKDSVTTKFARHDYLPQLRTHIGADVWIGDGAFVKAGVRIGHGAIIGMGAVVTHDVPPYAVVAGNPARLIRHRFEPQIVEGLLRSEWWTWPDARLREFGPVMTDPVAFLARLDAA
ncbi:CatB-related O-acetyltransferase [Roseateles sp.]|uniref:CatB-related O-acetyltransferase n=1 Tax=Roseateles sp. TaxID=1971397 RepID=UPI00393415D2